MALAKKIVIFFFFMTIIFQNSDEAVYKVGDSAGWTNSGVDYKSWAASKNFQVGDVLLFEYNKEFHNVIRVTHKNFNSCNGTVHFEIFNSGNDSFVIKRTGHYYFLCGFDDHCQDGQKVDIRVAGVQPPSSTPTSSPPPPAPSAPSVSNAGSSQFPVNLGLPILVLASAFMGLAL